MARATNSTTTSTAATADSTFAGTSKKSFLILKQSLMPIQKCYLIILIVLFSCKNNSANESPTEAKKNDSLTSVLEGKNMADTTGFFSNCEDLISNSSLGDIQGTEASKDSVKNIYVADNYTSKRTFEIIFLPEDANKRKDNQLDALMKDFHDGCTDFFSKFRCYAFICPMRDPDKQKDVHAMNIDFPVAVSVYKRIKNDNWRFIKTENANNFKEFSTLQFKTMYNIN